MTRVGGRRRPARWDAACAAYKTTAGALNTTADPAERAAIYGKLIDLTATLAATIDLEIMPPLEPGGGISYAQVYANAIELLGLLMGCERRFGQPRPAVAPFPANATTREISLWDRYTASADRRERAELLIDLYSAAEKRIGYEGADPLNTAARSELAISGGLTAGGRR